MIDFSHPYTPNVFSDAYAANQLQNYFNNIQTQQDVRAAGQIGATGDLGGMRNALLETGHIEQAGQTQNLLHAMDQQELEHRNDTYQLLGRAASLYGNDPDKWAQIINLVKSKGGNVQGLEDPNVGPAMMRGIAQTAQQNFDNEMKRRQVGATIAKLSQTYTDKDGNIWARTPTGQWINQGKPPAGVDISEPLGTAGEKNKWKVGSFKVATDPVHGDTYQLLKYNEATGEVQDQYGRPVKPPEDLQEQVPSLRQQPTAAAGAMPPATGAIPAAEQLPVPGTKGGTSEGNLDEQKFNSMGLNDVERARARAIVSGDEVLSPKEAASPLGRLLLSGAYALDPTFSRTNSEARAAFKKDFIRANGRTNQNSINFDTALEHATSIDQNIDELPDTGLLIRNAGKNWWKEQTTDPNLNAFKLNAEGLVGEVAKIFGGNQPAEAERERLLGTLSPNLGQTALRTAVAKMIDMMEGKQKSLDENWKNRMGPVPMPSGEVSTITAQGRENINNIKEKYSKLPGVILPKKWQAKLNLKSMSDDEILKALKAQ